MLNLFIYFIVRVQRGGTHKRCTGGNGGRIGIIGIISIAPQAVDDPPAQGVDRRRVKHHVVDVPARESRRCSDTPPADRPKKHQRPARPSLQRGQYPREWVFGQLRLRYRLKYQREPRAEATPLELIEALTGRLIDPIAADPLFSEAIALGAVIKRRESEVSHV